MKGLKIISKLNRENCLRIKKKHNKKWHPLGLYYIRQCWIMLILVSQVLNAGYQNGHFQSIFQSENRADQKVNLVIRWL